MDERRELVNAIERRIKQLVGSMKYSSHLPQLHDDEWKRVEQWVALRKQTFGTLLLPYAAEVERVRQLNSLLLGLSRELDNRVRDFYKFEKNARVQLVGLNDCFLEGRLNYEYEKPENGGFYNMDNDDWYGSDFNYMLSLEYQMTRRPGHNGMNAYWVSYAFDEEPNFDRALDDGRLGMMVHCCFPHSMKSVHAMPFMPSAVTSTIRCLTCSV